MNIKESKLKTNIICMYGITFFHNLIFAYVIECLFFLSRGFNLEILAITEIIYNSIVVLLEVPSGYIADMWSRKKILILSAILICLEYVALLLSYNIFIFFSATIFAAIGKAFSSGADNALLYDSLKALGREKSFNKHMSRIRFIDYSAGIVAALFGAYIAYTRTFELNYLLSLFSSILVLAFTLFLTEVSTDKTSSLVSVIKNSGHGYKKTLGDFKKVISLFIKNKTIVFVVMCGILTQGVVTQIDEYYQLLINQIGIPVYLFGFVSLFSLAACAVGSLVSIKLESFFQRKKAFILNLAIMTFSLLLMVFTRNLLLVIPLFIFYLCYSVGEPIIISRIHSVADDSLRATTESFYSLLERCSTTIIVIPFALLSHRIDMRVGIIFLIAILIIGITAFSVTSSKEEKSNSIDVA